MATRRTSGGTRGPKDMYANIIFQTVTQASANDLVFAEIDVGLNLFDKVGLLINRVEYDLTGLVNEMQATTDAAQMGLTASNQITSLDFSERAVIDYLELDNSIHGTAANLQTFIFPFIRDFSTMPGGGILVSPKPLYLALDSTGFASAQNVTARIYFTILKLSDADYFELLESRRFFG